MSANMVFTLGLRHTLALWQRALALVQFLEVQTRSLRLGRCRKNLPLLNCAKLSAMFLRVKRVPLTLKNIVCAKIVPSSKPACYSASVIFVS